MSAKTILIILAVIIVGRIAVRLVYFLVTKRPLYGFESSDVESGLSAVRLIGPRSSLEKLREAAAGVRWTESSYDAKGRLLLPVPPNYTSEDFGRLLHAIDPNAADLQGLQMLGPHGGPVDDKGVEHPDV